MMRRWAIYAVIDGMPVFVAAFASQAVASERASGLASVTGGAYRVAEQIVPLHAALSGAPEIAGVWLREV